MKPGPMAAPPPTTPRNKISSPVPLLVKLVAFGLLSSSLILFFKPSPPHHQSTPNTMDDREILDTCVFPKHYAIDITPDLSSKAAFQGSVTIDLFVRSQTTKITFNSKELTLNSAILAVGNDKYNVLNMDMNPKLEQASLSFKNNADGGLLVLKPSTSAKLHIQFTGIHNDQMAGFYRSTYDDQTGVKKTMVVTQFEATDARRAFPCWDEPLIKATFDVTLNVDPELTALSNMNVESETSQDGKKSIRFATTPIMSTYLLAFAVGEFEFIEAKTSPSCKALPNPVTVRVYTTIGESFKGKFALGCAVRILEYFSEVFGEQYPLPKMDMIAVPDFSAGAMENWGLVTYRTVYLLFEEANSSAKTKQGVAYVVAHELAHQWFGNLVTMNWWDELWLNEGFATWVGWLATDALFPDWSVWTSFVADDMSRALSLDGLRSSHPIQVPVKAATDISQIFDAISYSKGASVIRMLSSWLTQEVFLAGIRKYIQRHKYGNATTGDLWKALAEASGMNVDEFMSLWTTIVGYPVLSAARVGNKVTVSQDRFLSGGGLKPEENKTVWWCPLNLYTGAKEPHADNYLLKTRSAEFDIGPNPDLDFYKINRHQTNFYRVNYDAKDLEKLGAAISTGKYLSTSDRVGLISDTFALASAGYTSTVDALGLLKHFNNEEKKEYIVLQMLSEKLAQLKTVCANESDVITEKLQVLTRQIFAPTAHQMGWEFPIDGETQLEAMLRTLVIGVAGINGDKLVISEARTRFSRYIDGDATAIHPNLRSSVYSIVLKNAGHDSRMEYDQIKSIWEDQGQAMDQRLAALSALGKHPSVEISKELLAYALKHVRLQDFMYPLRSVASNPKTRHIAWAFVQDQWDVLEDRYRSNSSLLSHCVSIAADWASKEFAEKEVSLFFKPLDTKAVDRAIQQTLEKIQAQAQWLDRDREDIQKWLVANVNE